MSQAIQFLHGSIFKALEVKFLADATSTFDSRKNCCVLPVWTHRDRAFCEVAEHASDILAFEDRPEILPLRLGNRDVFYVVDFRVTTQTSSFLVGLSLFGKPGHREEAAIHSLARAYILRSPR